MSPADIKLALSQRGVYLNPGIEKPTAVEKTRLKNISLDPYILEVFSQFDGFQEGALDPGSGIRIWSLDQILNGTQKGCRRAPFADFLMKSNEYSFDLENANAKILLDEESLIAESFSEFLQQLISGYHDF